MTAKKRTSLEAIFSAEDLPPAPVKPKQGRAKPKPPEAVIASPENPAQEERAGELKRPKFKQHTAYLPKAVHEQLRKLAFEENRKMHDYLIEGLDRVFADRGLPTIKEIR